MTNFCGSWCARVAALVGGCLFAYLALAQSLQVIDLKYRTAEQVIPVLQPLLESGGALTGQDYQLFVRASSANVAQLRQALAQIDRRPRQFLVSVRRSTRQDIEREQAAVSATIGSDGANVTLRATDSSEQRAGNGITSVSVLEGNAAQIASGESVPMITSGVVGGSARHSRAGVSMGYRDLNSGFTVTPRLAGEQIVLDISQQVEQRAGDGGIQTQHLTTQVTGKLGEWLPLGGIQQSAQTQSSGIASGRHATRSDEQAIWVKVEE